MTGFSTSIGSLQSLLQRLKRDDRGVAAVEFALTCPLLIVLMVGLIEISNFLMAERRTLNVASTVGDLIAQGTDITSDEMTDIILGGRYVMRPFDEANLTIGAVSVRFNETTGTPETHWTSSVSYNTGSVSNPTTQATGLGIAGESVIIVTVTYTYEPIIGFVLPNDIVIEETVITRPRYVDFVEYPA